jgi:signal transduction histidine kinase
MVNVMEPRATVDIRPQASMELIDHIQSVMERQKALLARELHDELGGLLVGAVMDIAWVEQHVAAPPAELRQKLTRARQTLAAAIDLKRKLIEDLRPSLLDNVGLFAALRWHVQATCKRLGLTCNVQVPEDERRFLPNLPIALFRIVQEALAVIVAAKPAARVTFSVAIDGESLVIDILSDSQAPPAAPVTQDEIHFLAAIDHRIASLGGEFRHQRGADGAIRITGIFPLDATLTPLQEPV